MTISQSDGSIFCSKYGLPGNSNSNKLKGGGDVKVISLELKVGSLKFWEYRQPSKKGRI